LGAVQKFVRPGAAAVFGSIEDIEDSSDEESSSVPASPQVVAKRSATTKPRTNTRFPSLNLSQPDAPPPAPQCIDVFDSSTHVARNRCPTLFAAQFSGPLSAVSESVVGPFVNPSKTAKKPLQVRTSISSIPVKNTLLGYGFVSASALPSHINADVVLEQSIQLATSPSLPVQQQLQQPQQEKREQEHPELTRTNQPHPHVNRLDKSLHQQTQLWLSQLQQHSKAQRMWSTARDDPNNMQSVANGNTLSASESKTPMTHDDSKLEQQAYTSDDPSLVHEIAASNLDNSPEFDPPSPLTTVCHAIISNAPLNVASIAVQAPTSVAIIPESISSSRALVPRKRLKIGSSAHVPAQPLPGTPPGFSRFMRDERIPLHQNPMSSIAITPPTSSLSSHTSLEHGDVVVVVISDNESEIQPPPMSSALPADCSPTTPSACTPTNFTPPPFVLKPFPAVPTNASVLSLVTSWEIQVFSVSPTVNTRICTIPMHRKISGTLSLSSLRIESTFTFPNQYVGGELCFVVIAMTEEEGTHFCMGCEVLQANALHSIPQGSTLDLNSWSFSIQPRPDDFNSSDLTVEWKHSDIALRSSEEISYILVWTHLQQLVAMVDSTTDHVRDLEFVAHLIRLLMQEITSPVSPALAKLESFSLRRELFSEMINSTRRILDFLNRRFPLRLTRTELETVRQTVAALKKCPILRKSNCLQLPAHLTVCSDFVRQFKALLIRYNSRQHMGVGLSKDSEEKVISQVNALIIWFENTFPDHVSSACEVASSPFLNVNNWVEGCRFLDSFPVVANLRIKLERIEQGTGEYLMPIEPLSEFFGHVYIYCCKFADANFNHYIKINFQTPCCLKIA
jgi:hypothetical protein